MRFAREHGVPGGMALLAGSVFLLVGGVEHSLQADGQLGTVGIDGRRPA